MRNLFLKENIENRFVTGGSESSAVCAAERFVKPASPRNEHAHIKYALFVEITDQCNKSNSTDGAVQVEVNLQEQLNCSFVRSFTRSLSRLSVGSYVCRSIFSSFRPSVVRWFVAAVHLLVRCFVRWFFCSFVYFSARSH